MSMSNQTSGKTAQQQPANQNRRTPKPAPVEPAPALVEHHILEVDRGRGDATVVSLRDYKGNWRIDVRQYFTPADSEDLKPTKFGAIIPLESLDDLIAGLEEVRAARGL